MRRNALKMVESPEDFEVHQNGFFAIHSDTAPVRRLILLA